jgi:outer membrane lipoprotein carrier protein
MKRFYTILVLLIGVITIKTNAQATNDPDAKKILDGVSAKFKTYKTVKSTFTFKTENAAGKALSSKNGTVWIKGNKYKVTIVGQETRPKLITKYIYTLIRQIKQSTQPK